MLRFLVLIFTTFILSGCASIYGKNSIPEKRLTEYLHATETPPIQLPPGVSSSAVGEDYVLPPATGPVPTQSINIIPPESLAQKIASGEVPKSVLKEKVIITPVASSVTTTPTIGGSQLGAVSSNGLIGDTLSLNQSVQQVWPMMAVAIPRAGYKVLTQNANTGIYYILDMPSTGGQATKDSPIYQLHFVNAGSGSQVTVTDNQGAQVASSTAQRVLTSINTALVSGTNVVSSGNQAVWSLSQPVVQEWSNIAVAIYRAGYKTLVANPKTAVYYILDMPSTGGKATKATPIYQLHFVNVGSGSQATITDNAGKPVASNVAQRILTSLSNVLISSPNVIISGNNAVLPLAQPVTKSWGDAESALRKVGYRILNQNQSTGIYYILDLPSTYGFATKDTPIYQVHYVNVGTGSQVTVTDNDGKAVPVNVAQRVLTDLDNALTGKTPSELSKFLHRIFHD